jgi:hypothetical protein
VALAAPEESTTSAPVKAPDVPSAALLEFIGDWTEDERQLLNMDLKTATPRKVAIEEGRRRAP